MLEDHLERDYRGNFHPLGWKVEVCLDPCQLHYQRLNAVNDFVPQVLFVVGFLLNPEGVCIVLAVDLAGCVFVVESTPSSSDLCLWEKNRNKEWKRTDLGVEVLETGKAQSQSDREKNSWKIDLKSAVVLGKTTSESQCQMAVGTVTVQIPV